MLRKGWSNEEIVHALGLVDAGEKRLRSFHRNDFYVAITA